ncbi:MAG: Protein GrpE [Candidatus Roizmanbacteria bacterium GW2011_GWA2_35_19]|uniref:Protein GrpE n=2 Tax=Candidatus Roizmaniibacteriota TaxID=1752723 RepID=A0A0G0BWX4_9BACT|nr:MAG: Protein GrpE [Candidatus Roizmanbacteria bacterium GW2011_GWC2_35_12]KKP73748.1 MAG: Protein GrpE [Candidatus Roizmanbacteria bacterium GW2011_GWA2_35_19]
MDDKKKKKETKKIDDKLELELTRLKNQVEEFKSKYLRALADYQNLEKRVSQEREGIIKSANNTLILKILPFLDNLEKAQAFVNDPGLKLAKDNLFNILKEVGLQEIEVINKEYDPYTAEVIDMVEGNKENIVAAVLRKGYRINSKVLRVAQVKVSKKIEVQNPKLEANKSL